jgi:hypothetical protein
MDEILQEDHNRVWSTTADIPWARPTEAHMDKLNAGFPDEFYNLCEVMQVRCG